MATPISLALYRNQFDALLGAGKVVDNLITLYGGMPVYDAVADTGLPRRETILGLLNRFKEYTPAHFNFFFNGFTNKTAGQVSLYESRVDPASAVMGTILFQMAEDLELIQRAAEQRLSPQFRPTLAKADKLAWLAVQKAMAMFPAGDQPITALTYFHKMAEVRVVPYASIALIGIPLTCIYEERDFLAIPHEVGHFVYHRRQTNPTQDPVNHGYMRQQGDDNPTNGVQTDWALWQEELFADVLGALVAGPVMAYDFQQLMRQYERRAFVSLHDSHPASALRPLIYSHVLQTKAAWSPLANLLDGNWREILQDRWRGTHADRGSGVLNQKRGAAELAEWKALLGNPVSNDFETVQAAMTLERLAAMCEKDIIEGNEWDGETNNYLAQLYSLLRLLDFSGGGVRPIAPIRDFIDAALSKMNVAVSDWSGVLADMKDELLKKGEPDKPYKANLPTLIAGVNVPELPAASPPTLWNAWIIREQLFGGILPTALPVGPSGMIEINKGGYDDIVLNQPIPTDPTKYTWLPVWYAGGWTSEPPTGSPPGGKVIRK